MSGYPLILNGDHAEFEAEWAGKDPKTRPDWPLPSFDARDWAEAFDRFNPGHNIPEGVMLSWFANSLMRGFDEHASRPATPAQPAGAVPDSLRALSEVKQGVVALRDQAYSNLAFYKEHGSDLALLESQNLAAYEAVLGLFASHPAGQSAGSGADLTEPHAVFLAMHAGKIAKPTLDRLVQIYGADTLREYLARLGPETDLAATARSRGEWGLKGGHDTEGTSKLLIEIADRLSSALDSTRTGQGEASDGWVLVPERMDLAMIGAFWRWKNTGSDTPGEFGDDRSDAAAYRAMLAARPAAPEAQGAWRPIAEAPKDGTEIWAWLYDSGVRKVRWWSAEEICEEEGRNTPEAYQAGFYEVSDRTEWWNPAWWVPAARLPAPPASSGQEG